MNGLINSIINNEIMKKMIRNTIAGLIVLVTILSSGAYGSAPDDVTFTRVNKLITDRKFIEAIPLL